MKWIRWQGLLPFLLLTVALTVAGAFYSNTFLKHLLEHYGSQLAGAEVNVQTAKIHFHPLGFTLRHLEITDRKKPTHNLFAIAEVKGDLNLPKLLLKQTAIEHINIEGLRFQNPRQRPGKRFPSETNATMPPTSLPPEQSPPPAGSPRSNGLPSLENLPHLESLPNIETLLQQEPLLTLQLAKDLEHFYQEENDKIETLKHTLPNREKLRTYEQRVKNLTDSKIADLDDFNQRNDELKKIKRAIQQDKKTIRRATQQLQSSSQRLRTALKAIKAAPQKDLKKIRRKYALNERGAANASALLFGDSAQQWTQQLIAWHTQLSPFLTTLTDSIQSKPTNEPAPSPRHSGTTFTFPLENPHPQFLIKKATLSGRLEQGPFHGEIHHLTNNQSILNQPTRFHVASQAFSGIESVTLSGQMDTRQPQKPHTRLNLELNNLTTTQLTLSGDNAFPLTLERALVHLSGTANLTPSTFEAEATLHFNDVAFTSSADTKFAQEVTLALKNIHQFSVNLIAHNTVEDRKMELSSDLDKQLKNAFKKQLKAKQTAFENKLNEKLAEQLGRSLNRQQTHLDDWGLEEKGLQGTQKQLEKLAKTKLEDYEEEQKRKLQEKEHREKERLRQQKIDARKKAEQKLKESLKEKFKGFEF